MATEPPDFTDRARVLVDAFMLDPDVWGSHGEPGSAKLAIIMAAIAEQLRQVWNARGAADREAINAALEPGENGNDLERALRTLDR